MKIDLVPGFDIELLKHFDVTDGDTVRVERTGDGPFLVFVNDELRGQYESTTAGDDSERQVERN